MAKKKLHAAVAQQHIANPSPPPSTITNVTINPTSGAGGPCQQGCTVISSLQFTVSGVVAPPPNPASQVEGYVYANSDSYAAEEAADVDPMSGEWSLSFDLSTWNPPINTGTTGQLKVYYTDPNDPASYLLSPICFNLGAGAYSKAAARRARKGR